MLSFGVDSKWLGYRETEIVIYSLHERLKIALDCRQGELRRALQRYAVSYRIDTPQELMQFVAFLDKPLAELLDDLEIPREYEKSTFIELVGPTQYIKKECVVRRVVPGLVSAPKGFDLVVQPMFRHLVSLPILVQLDLSDKKYT